MNYAVIGTGGIGGFYGGHLARIGRDVRFLLRSDYTHVQKEGLFVESPQGDFHISPDRIQAHNDVATMGTADIILVCLKTTQNDVLAQLLPPLIHEKSVVILMQNGYGIESAVSDFIPGTAMAGGLAFICSQKNAPGRITHLDYGKLTLGAHDNRANDALERVAADFRSAGIDVVITPDLIEARWRKLVWNVPFNGLSVILNAQTDEMIEHPQTRALIEALMGEVLKAAYAIDQRQIPADFVDEMIDATQDMKPYAPSMKLDFDAGRPLELAAIYGNVLHSAEMVGLRLPHIQTVYRQMQTIEQQRITNKKF